MLTKVAEIFVFQGNTLNRIIPLLTKNMPEERDSIVNIYVYNGNNTKCTIVNRDSNDIIRNNEWFSFMWTFFSFGIVKKYAYFAYSEKFVKTLNFFLISIFMEQFVRHYTLSSFKFSTKYLTGDNCKKYKQGPFHILK